MSADDHHAGRRRLLRKLSSLEKLSAADTEAILALPMTVREYQPHHLLVQEWDKLSGCHLILDGFACRHKSLPNGSRQILSFHTPGDILDLQNLYLETIDYGVSTVVPTLVGHLTRSTLHELTQNHPGIARAFWRDSLVDAAIFREWMLSLGRRTARSHLAHLLCEMMARFRVVSQTMEAAADAGTGVMPLGQDDLADALGLTRVEINRELQGLQREGLITVGGSVLEILDQERLAQICSFDPAYLYQDRAP